MFNILKQPLGTYSARYMRNPLLSRWSIDRRKNGWSVVEELMPKPNFPLSWQFPLIPYHLNSKADRFTAFVISYVPPLVVPMQSQSTCILIIFL